MFNMFILNQVDDILTKPLYDDSFVFEEQTFGVSYSISLRGTVYALLIFVLGVLNSFCVVLSLRVLYGFETNALCFQTQYV